MNKDDSKIKKTPAQQPIDIPMERMGQQPASTESELTRELLQDPHSKLKVLQGKMPGITGFDTPHLSKHNQARTFMISLLPVALQQGVEEMFFKRFPEWSETPGGVIHFKGHTYADNVFYQQLKQLRNQEKLSDILISTDINCLFDYRKRYISKLNFDSFSTQYNPCFAGSGLEHPQKIFRFLGADALVMVADRNLHNRQLPREWYELLNPELKNSLVLCGDTDYSSLTLYLHYVRDFGLEAVRQLHRNTLERMHPEDMLHVLNNNNTPGANIYVMPYSYAKRLDNKIDYQIIWPDDGAIIIPIQMLVKKDASEKYRNITRFLGGQEVGNYLRDQGFISTNPRVTHPVQGRKLNWLGWDFIRNTQLEELKNDIQRILAEE